MSSLPANELAFTIVVGLILTISVVCNIMVVVVVMVNPGLRNPTNLLICNLSVGDLILASVVLPQNLHDLSHVDESYFEGAFLCKVVYTCPLICIMASIYSMVAISFERTQVILITRSNKLTIRRTVILLAVLWIFAVVFALPTAHEHSVYVRDRKENGTTILGCGTDGVSYEYSVVNGVWLLFVAYLIPLVILLVNYWRILRYFW
ncbi:pyroglutamylated RF-amide peptide receptor-like [Babylonia areolata]|uniref:pyroglutamylated RF-amide peptide receptor-like n=1 Tax=Babylonia areolata TaxID=304850 RepID=UPI003FD14A66